ncbi:hypothetical protein ABE15_30335 [Bacillus cereus]|nr:hypothetical protein [Bacillus cereus]MBG9611663.1 hypothetical protein [Bacillus cereus]MBG9617277.1 hypothetical protein [Bacillus cereus]MBG9617281.1 hypothetical protein [Bacillus cereus]
MTQTITVTVKLLPTKEQIRLLEQSSHEYRKVIHVLRQLDEKEQRWRQDHKVSRVIVDFATDHTISVIRLEKLTNMKTDGIKTP